VGEIAENHQLAPQDESNQPPSLPATFSYRPEIDGLRALAVTAVITNHINNKILASGYLGVDIFFVISGYVITASLSGRKSKNLGEFISGFYSRRIKRLMPALAAFALIMSLLICVFNPDPKLSLATGIASLVGMSNLYLLQQSTDYFAQSSQLNPFTHTWSLGVEEQFYFLFPLLIWFSGFGRQARNGSRNLFIAITLLTTASLAAFVRFYPTNPSAAYFLSVTRFWEMAAGCLVFIVFQKRAAIEQALERVPPLLIVAAMTGIMFLPISTAVPATISIVALSSVLIACLKPGTLAHRIFSQKHVVYIGLISYSLYLWHWGILSITRWTIGLSWWSTPLILIAILACSDLSYKYIEQPTRSLQPKQARTTFLAGGVAIATTSSFLLFLISPAVHSKFALVHEGDGAFQEGASSQRNYVGPTTRRKNSDCQSGAKDISPTTIQNSIDRCFWKGLGQGSTLPVVAILGDSHAHQLFPIAESIAKEFGLPVYNYFYWGCIVPRDVEYNLADKDCANVDRVPEWFYDQVKRPTIFIIASYADPIINFPSDLDQRKRVEIFKHAFSRILDQGNRLIVVAPNPKFFDIDNSMSDTCGPAPWSRLNPICQKDYTFDAISQRNQREVYLKSLHQWAASDPRVLIVDPYWILCDNKDGRCHSRKDGASKYWDPTHLNLRAVISTYPLYQQAVKTMLARMGVEAPQSASRHP
jgi:peptidoglycan/LPS O-acetylase OafA/YrhL